MSLDGSLDATVEVTSPGPIGDDERAQCGNCPTGRANDAVFCVPDPRQSGPVSVPLCAYHLAALRRSHPLQWRTIRQHPEVEGLEAATKGHALLERDDVPAEIGIDGTLYERLGLDELGRAHFVAETGQGAYRVIETNERFVIRESNLVAPEALAGLLDHVGEHVGWRSLEGGWVERAGAEAEGGDPRGE